MCVVCRVCVAVCVWLMALVFCWIGSVEPHSGQKATADGSDLVKRRTKMWDEFYRGMIDDCGTEKGYMCSISTNLLRSMASLCLVTLRDLPCPGALDTYT
ncbi:hypothetical protein GE21DRAFT_1282195 [Neurospora crassa]|nr:hypothetical protein GE21DRAFT_1282195 [Neurospora crassa]